MLRQTARVFLESTSLRGVGKVVKTQSSFLSKLWALFVLASSTVLFLSVFKITADYLQYDVNIQTYLDIDDATPFPAVSICNNQPFSQQAYRLWEANQIRSPTKFNQDLRDIGFRILNDSSIVETYMKMKNAESKEQEGSSWQYLMEKSRRALTSTMVMDTSRMYYQNLRPNESRLLGHLREESIIDCIFKFDHLQVQGTRGCIDPMVEVTEFSHPNFFNCMTINFKPDSWKDVFSLTLIMWLGPDENYDIRYRQGFLYDVFEQAYGLRVAIHEPGTPPRILEQGMQTEPGKMNEVKYHPVKFIREDTPKNPCIQMKEAQSRRFRDLRNWYTYDLELCLNSKVQEIILQKCGCMYIELPRVALPNDTQPYCGQIDDKLSERYRCLKSINQREIRKSFEGSDCLPKCTDLSYDKDLSMTKWRDTQWMLYWIKQISERWNNYFRNVNLANVSKEEFQKDLELVKDYLRFPNLTDLRLFTNDSANSTDSFKFNDRYTFLVVKRQSNNTLVKKEKIVLTLNALFSRIGGLCSMYMGLTLAFFMECVEFLYSLICEKKPLQKSMSKAEDRVVEVTEEANLMKPSDAADQTAAGGSWQRQNCRHPRDAAAPGPSAGNADFIWIRQASNPV